MCSCGCNTCETKAPLLTEGVLFEQPISENLLYHIKNGKPITENTFRYGSTAFINLWKEARTLYSRNILDVGEDDEHILLETHLGEYGMFEGERVPLDLPMLEEGGEDTSWTDEEGNKITLQDILDLTKAIPQKDYPTEKLAKIVLNWDNNPEEIERIEQVEVSKQYPILIMVDERGEIQWILDGNHRAQKALQSKSKTIPAKLIKPSNLDAKAKKILLGVVDKNVLSEAKYQGKEVALGKPKRGGSKKFYVYVMNPKTKKVQKVSFGGTTGLTAKINDSEARTNFAKRHNCAEKKDKTKPGYWACRLPRYASLLGLKGSYSGFW